MRPTPGPPPPPPLQVLLVTRSGRDAQALVRRLGAAGCRVDVARGEAEAVEVFYREGGHRLCVVDPALPPVEGRTLARRLRELDPALWILAALEPHGRAATPGIQGLPALHLFSRAGIGWLLGEILRWRGAGPAGRPMV